MTRGSNFGIDFLFLELDTFEEERTNSYTEVSDNFF